MLVPRATQIAVNPPRPRFPPLNALRALEAAARHESFAKAADELGVTPAAVSHQVKALEQWLGRELFVRHAQGLHLAESARKAMPSLSGAFDSLGRAIRELRADAPATSLDIAALPAVAQLWLAPRLSGLRRASSGLQPSVHALELVPNLQREPFDIAIFYQRDAVPGVRAFTICEDVIFPVCTLAIAAELHVPADLAAWPLLRDTAWADDWPCWLAAAGIGGIATRSGPAFSLYSLAVEAALEGAGLLMGHEALIAAHLAAGKLLAPFAVRARTGLRLEILAPAKLPTTTMRVIDWLIADKCAARIA